MVQDAQREVLAVSFLVTPGALGDATAGTVRFRGRRAGSSAQGRHHTFTAEERIEHLPAGVGPFTVTKVVRGIEPGEWSVTAELVRDQPGHARGPRRGVPSRSIALEPAEWSWRHWRPVPKTGPWHTGAAVVAPRPAVLFGIWPTLVALGIVVAILLQVWLARRAGIPVARVLAASVAAVALGGVGAKVWYLVQRRPGASWNGWCIQGFVLAVLLVALFVVPALGLPLGEFLDVTTPAMFAGMAIGRIGCFLAGCCVGRPTCGRFGVWSSDRRLGIRRVPAQLLEATLAATVAAVTLGVVVVGGDDPDGPLFGAALGAYTLARQGLLQVRAEARRTSRGTVATAVTAALAFVVAAGSLVVT